MPFLLLFLWAFLAATILPLSAEAYFIYVVTVYKSWSFATMVAGLGNTLGSLTLFYMGWKGGEYALKKLSTKNQKRYDQASRMLRKYGSFVLILAWVPFIGDVLVFLAGGLKAPVGWSTFWISLGKFGRFALLGMITMGLL